MNMITRGITYIIITAFVLALAWLGTAHKDNLPGVIFLPSGQHFAPVNPETVTLLENRSTNGHPVGQINLQYYTKVANQNTIKILEQYVITIAAQNGANRVVIEQFGQDPSENRIILQATALRN